nr:hypothetical protein [Armatimonas sp.]
MSHELAGKVVRFAEEFSFSTSIPLPDGAFLVETNPQYLGLWWGNQKHYFPKKHPLFRQGFCEWKWVRENELKKLWGVMWAHPEGELLEQKLKAQFPSGKQIVQQLPEAFREFAYDMHQDFVECALSRALRGQESEFYERIFQAYQAGYFPCGWSGKWPEGRLVVFAIPA